MVFTLKIEIGNDAMQSNGDVADALRGVADMFARYHSEPVVADGHLIRDLNGNTIGSWAVA